MRFWSVTFKSQGPFVFGAYSKREAMRSGLVHVRDLLGDPTWFEFPTVFETKLNVGDPMPVNGKVTV